MPSSFTPFDTTVPAGTQTGSAFATSANANDLALWYAGVTAVPRGWTLAIAGGTAEEPTTYTWSNGAYRVRSTNTWSGGGLTQQVIDVSQDSGATYANYDTQTRSFDGSGNLTTTTGGGGFTDLLAYAIRKVKALLTSFNTHTGTLVVGAPHGIASMAGQSNLAVNIDGGTIDAVTIGGAADTVATFKWVKGKVVNLGTVSVATAVDWNSGDYFVATLAAGGSFTWSNLPASGSAQGLTIELTNPATTFNPFPVAVKWPGAAVPTFTVSGVDVFEFFCRDGTTVRGVQAEKDSR